MIDNNGWFDWAVKDPGDASRLRYYNKNTKMKAIIHHSMEGTYSPGGYAAFKDPSRFPTLWHGTIKYNGALYQHAPVMAMTVHAHSGNSLGPGFESEGFSSEPITPAQIKTFLRIHADMHKFTGKDYSRQNKSLLEHREVGPTGCPSDRYEPLWEYYESEGNEMSSTEYIEVMKLIFGEDYKERVQQLRDIGAGSIEQRISRFESNTGPIGSRLNDLEQRQLSTEVGLVTLEIRHGLHTGDEETDDGN